MRKTALAGALLAFSIHLPVHAAGIPVDSIIANLNAALSLLDNVTIIEQGYEQIEQNYGQLRQLEEQVRSTTGNRGLGALHRSPLVNNYVAVDAPSQLENVARQGYGALSGPAKTLRDARMLYNCMELPQPQRVSCQAALAMPYVARALLDRSMGTATSRMGQIQALIDAINVTNDPKSAQELQARLAGEQALLAHEASRVQILESLVRNDEALQRSREREMQLENLSRPMPGSRRAAPY
jgi:type IV secretion system protein VirB5